MSQLSLDIQGVALLRDTQPAGGEAIFREAVSAVLAHKQVSGEVSLSILLTDDEQMWQLNRDFAGLDEPTDVLSFGMEAGDEMMPEALAEYLGDIAISVEMAARQAEKGGHSLTAELQLLTVHGVLHLLGYDHDGPEEKAAMWAAQEAALERLGVEIRD